MKTNKELIRQYCIRRPLHRPNVHWLSVPCVLLALEAASQATAWLLRSHLNIPSAWAYALGCSVCLIAVGRWIAILSVKLYQRYAPEDMRRRCHCMPSCSEYSIAALRKYGLVIGGIKTLKRIFITCGSEYVYDAP